MGDPGSVKTARLRARQRRRGYPIHAYVGANGGGKTMAAVYDTLPTLAAGRHVVSTCRILDPATGQPHPLWVPLDDYRTLLEVENCDVVADEVTGIASSRESQGMPAAIANLLVQLRRRDVAFRWTAPSWKRADTIIRECSQATTLCMGFVPETVSDETGERQWRSRKLFYWRTYDAATFDEWTTHRRERIKPAARQLMWRPGSMAERAYDTFDSVLSLGAVTDAGTCMDCGGYRQKMKCPCARPAASRAVPVIGRHTAPVGVLIPETDDTPAVVLAPAAAN